MGEPDQRQGQEQGLPGEQARGAQQGRADLGVGQVIDRGAGGVARPVAQHR